MSRSGGPNFLGAKYAPFVVPDDPNRPDFRVRDVALPRGLNDARVRSAVAISAAGVDHLQRITEAAAADPVPALDEYYQQGYDLSQLDRRPVRLRHLS